MSEFLIIMGIFVTILWIIFIDESITIPVIFWIGIAFGFNSCEFESCNKNKTAGEIETPYFSRDVDTEKTETIGGYEYKDYTQ